MRVLAITQRLLELAAKGAPLAGILADLFPVPFGDRRIIGRRARVGLRGETPARLEAHPALLHLCDRGVDIGAIGADCNEIGILGGGAQHGRPADVDVLDAIVEARACLHGGLERVEVDPDEVDGLDVVVGSVLGVGRKVAAIEKSAMHFRVQGLHTAIHHLGKASEVSDVTYRKPGFLKRLRCASRGDQIDAEPGQLPRPLHQPRLVGHREQRTPDGDALGYVSGDGFGGRHGATPAHGVSAG